MVVEGVSWTTRPAVSGIRWRGSCSYSAVPGTPSFRVPFLGTEGHTMSSVTGIWLPFSLASSAEEKAFS